MPRANRRWKASTAKFCPKRSAPLDTKMSCLPAPCKPAWNFCTEKHARATPFSPLARAALAACSTNSPCCLLPRFLVLMRISEKPVAERLKELGVELRPAVALSEKTSLGIGGTTDELLLRRLDTIPEVMRLLANEKVAYRFLGGGTNVLIDDGELPWIVLHLPTSQPGMRVEGNAAYVDAAADLGGMVTFCAKRDLGGMEGLIGVPGSVGGALRMNAGAYGTQIGSYVREVELYRASTGKLEILRGDDIRFDYRHTSFAVEDVMLRVKLELPSKPFKEILALIKVCNEKRRASQPLNQKSAGCIFKNPPGGSAGRMIDELGLKGHRVGDAMVSDRHANFFVNVANASCADMLRLIDEVRERVRVSYGVELDNEVIFWKN